MDPNKIEGILSQLGLSADDLLAQLLKYKGINNIEGTQNQQLNNHEESVDKIIESTEKNNLLTNGCNHTFETSKRNCEQQNTNEISISPAENCIEATGVFIALSNGHNETQLNNESQTKSPSPQKPNDEHTVIITNRDELNSTNEINKQLPSKENEECIEMKTVTLETDPNIIDTKENTIETNSAELIADSETNVLPPAEDSISIESNQVGLQKAIIENTETKQGLYHSEVNIVNESSNTKTTVFKKPERTIMSKHPESKLSSHLRAISLRRTRLISNIRLKYKRLLSTKKKSIMEKTIVKKETNVLPPAEDSISIGSNQVGLQKAIIENTETKQGLYHSEVNIVNESSNTKTTVLKKPERTIMSKHPESKLTPHLKAVSLRRARLISNIRLKYKRLQSTKKKSIMEKTIVKKEIEMQNPPPITPQKTKEVVRNKIMEQLTLLRTKRTDFANIFQVKPNASLQNSGGHVVDGTPSTSKECNVKGKEEQICDEKKECRILPNRDQVRNCLPISKPSNVDGILPTKTKDVTKIKGWKHKKFVTPQNNDEGVTENVNKVDLKVPKQEPEEELSAFASSSLDGFLEEAGLNISYEIPTLTIEKTEKKDDLSVICVPEPAVRSTPTKKDKEFVKNKPRTVAEKRKLEEEAAAHQTIEEIPTKKQKSQSSELKTEAKKTNMYFSDGRITVNTRSGKDIFVKTPLKSKVSRTKSKKKYMYVPYYKRKCNEMKSSRLSIFSDETKSKKLIKSMRYKAGPLSKKVLLQDKSAEEQWETVVKDLPNVYLEILPEVGKPIHPALRGLIQCNHECLPIENVEFALSMLKDEKGNGEKYFKFPVCYSNNQKSLILRQRVIELGASHSEPVVIDPETDKDLEEILTDVISDMINYVETKEIIDDIIKEDFDISTRVEDKNNMETKNTGSSGAEVLNRRIPRRSKTTLELKRLNVKVIEVDIEKKTSNQPCEKPYCRLGCVCSSLDGSMSMPSHCGLLKCMFTCSCNHDKLKSDNPKVFLPSGTDLFSMGTIDRLQNEAKKNLAKLEKEFTQTVIQANNQTIVIPNGRDRQRRATKYPKKYADYTEPLFEMNAGLYEPQSSYIDNCNFEEFYRECKVKLPRLDLSDLLPFCLVHRCYDCSCLGQQQTDRVLEELPCTKYNSDNLEDVNKNLEKKNIQVAKRNTIYKLQNEEPSIKVESCSRTRGISTNYYFTRNRSALFKHKLMRKLRLEKHCWEKAQEVEVECPIEVARVENEKKDRRKQSFQIRNDTKSLIDVTTYVPEPIIDIGDESCFIPPETKYHENSMQKRKIKPKKAPKENGNKEKENKPMDSSMTQPELRLQKKFLQMLGKPDNGDAKFRLLPWLALLENYRNESLFIWCSTTSSGKYHRKLLITESKSPITANFINIKYYEEWSSRTRVDIDLVRWILSGNVPKEKNPADILVILSCLRSNVWEICGICERKNLPTKNNEPSDIQQGSNLTSSCLKTYGMSRNKVWYFKTKFTPKVLTISSGQKIFANLPNLNPSWRWRAVHLRGNLQMIKFVRNGFLLKAFDIQKILNIAKVTSQTIVLMFREQYNVNQKDFGIYASPNTTCVFIGPYEAKENHNLEILYDKPVNNSVPAQWVYQVFTSENHKVIDLTENDSDSEEQQFSAQFQFQESRSLLKSAQIGINQPIMANPDVEEFGKTDKEIDSFPFPSMLDNRLEFQKITIPSNQETNSKEVPELRPIINVVPLARLTNHSPTDQALVRLAENREINVSIAEPTDEELKCNGDEPVVEIQHVGDDPIYELDSILDSKLDKLIGEKAFQDKENRRYIITNLPSLGYLECFQVPNSEKFFIRWTNLEHGTMCFQTADLAIDWFKGKLDTNIIIIPRTFQLKVEIVKKIPSAITQVFDQRLLLGHYMVGSFGLLNILTSSEKLIKSKGLTEEELQEVFQKRTKKLFLIRTIQCAELFMSKSEAYKMQNLPLLLDILQVEIKKQEHQAKLYERTKTVLSDRKEILIAKRNMLAEKLPSLIARTSNINSDGNSNNRQSAPATGSKGTSSTTANDNPSICISSDDESETTVTKPCELSNEKNSISENQQAVTNSTITNSPQQNVLSKSRMLLPKLTPIQQSKTLESKSLLKSNFQEKDITTDQATTSKKNVITTVFNGQVVKLRVVSQPSLKIVKNSDGTCFIKGSCNNLND